jgi:hypothetical protein
METKTRLFARGSGTKQKVFSSKEKNVMFRWHLHVTCSVFLLGQLSAACTVQWCSRIISCSVMITNFASSTIDVNQYLMEGCSSLKVKVMCQRILNKVNSCCKVNVTVELKSAS